MSRDFIGSATGRSFKKSLNRDRVTRGGVTSSYFGIVMQALRSPQIPTNNSLLQSEELPAPTYLYHNSNEVMGVTEAPNGSLPLDKYPALFAQQIGPNRFFRIVLEVYGISDLYNPNQTITAVPFIYNAAFGSVAVSINISNAIYILWGDKEFAPMEDAYHASGYWRSQEEPDLPNAVNAPNKLLLNYSSTTKNGIYYWGKRITATCRTTQSAPMNLPITVQNPPRRQIKFRSDNSNPPPQYRFTFFSGYIRRNLKNGTAFNTGHPFSSGRNLIPENLVLNPIVTFNPELCNSVYGRMTSIEEVNAHQITTWDDIFDPVLVS